MRDTNNKKQNACIVILILLILSGITIACKHKTATKAKLKEAKQVNQLYAKTEQLTTIQYYPQGKLEIQVPTAISLLLPYDEKVEMNSTISYDNAKSCIKIEPEVKGIAVWVSTRSLEYRFEDMLTPETKYQIHVKCLPLGETRHKDIEALDFYFISPQLSILSGYANKWAANEIEAVIRWNYPLDNARLGAFIAISGDGKVMVKIKSAKISLSDEQAALINFKNTSKSYKIIFREGLPIKNNKGALKSIVTYDLPAPGGYEISLQDLTVTEGEDYYAIKVLCRAYQYSNCNFDATKIRSYITIKPAIKYKVVATSEGFELYGDFIPRFTYEITISAGLRTLDNAILKNDFKQSIQIPPPGAKLSFAIKGIYLGKKGKVSLPMRVRNFKNMRINAWRLPLRNLPLWYSDKEGRESGFRDLAEPVISGNIIDVKAGVKSKLYWLDLNSFLNTSEEGMYQIIAEVADDQASSRHESENYDYYDDCGGDYCDEQPSRLKTGMTVIISDISIITKLSSNSVYAWLLSSSSLAPIRDATVELWSSKNANMGTCTTDSEGFCSISYSTDRIRSPYVLTATKEKEFSFIYFDKSTLQTEKFEVSGNQIPSNNYLGYFYPERDLYRPGETVHFAFILREYGTYKGMKLPVIVTVKDPQGKELLSLHGSTDDAGLAEFTIPTERSQTTGKYSLDFKIANLSIADGYFFLEDFVPQQIKVSLHSDKTEYSAQENIRTWIQADYLFGAPAANQSYDLLCELNESCFSPANFNDYTFGVYKEQRPTETFPMQKGILDKHGKAEVNCMNADISMHKSPVKLSMTTHVTEAGSGRTSNAKTSVLIHPTPYYIGLKSMTANIQPGTDVEIAGVIVSKKGTLMTNIKHAHYRIYRMNHNYVRIYDAENNRFSWQWTWMHIPYTESPDLDVKNGKFQFNFKPMDYWSNYLIEVVDNNNVAQSSIVLFSWSYATNNKNISSPEMLRIKLDKETADYNARITASALLPFEGKILWTVELDDVIMHQLNDAKGETASFAFNAPSETNTVYVTALLITSNEKYSVRRAFGIQRVRIRPSMHILNVEMTAPDSVKPNTDLEVQIKAPEYFEGTISIVDEGILQITQFKTPQPLASIFADLALNTRTSETFGWLIRKDTFPEPGGGESAKVGETPSFVRIVSYWSGIVRSNNEGIADMKIRVPEFQGRLRVMLSAVNTMRIGSTEKDIQVASDVSIMPSMPRFVHTNDQINIPVSFMNNVKYKTSTSFSADIKGATLLKEYPATVDLKPHETAVVILPVKVTTEIEPLIVEITAKTKSELYNEKFTIYAKPDKPYLTETKYIELKQGTNQFTGYLNEWMPNRERVQMIVTPLPAIARLKHLSYLVHYPYGCVEQTSSSLLPLVRMQNVLDLIDPEIAEKTFLKEKVYSGIHRLLSMQTISGGFAYWPGDTHAEVWPSVYATFVLLEARNAGYIVPQNSLNSALNFLSAYGNKWAFSSYVMALGDYLKERNINDLQILASKPDLNSEELLFVAGALVEVGKTSLAQQVLDKALGMKALSNRNLNEDFYSSLRELALRLYFSEKIYPGSPKNESLMMQLVTKLSRDSWYYSTQELAWSIMALSSRIQNVQYAKTFTAHAVVDGKELKPVTTKWGLQWSFEINKIPAKEMNIDIKSDGELYLFTEVKGFKSNAKFQHYSNGIAIETQYYNYEGKVITDVPQKDIVIVELTINNTTARRLENVAISDYLPAGFEMENPRISVQNLPPWIDKNYLMNADYVDYRDERIDIFGSLSSGITKFYYVARATIIGDYFLPPTEAVVMYDPDIKARTSDSRVKVLVPNN